MGGGQVHVCLPLPGFRRNEPDSVPHHHGNPEKCAREESRLCPSVQGSQTSSPTPIIHQGAGAGTGGDDM